MNRFTIQHSFAISAGAGSGKTYTLSRRYINAVLGFDFFTEFDGQPQYVEGYEKRAADLHEIVTITYTEAAALEMKERIFALMTKVLHFDSLDRKDGDYDSVSRAFESLNGPQREYVRSRLQQALERVDEAIVTTFHGFCLRTLKRYGDYVGIDGALAVVPEDEREAKFEEAFYETINDDAHKKSVLEISRHVSLFKSREIIRRYVFDQRFRKNMQHFRIDSDGIASLLKAFNLPEEDGTLAAAMDEFSENGLDAALLREWVESFARFEAFPFSEIEERVGVKFDYRKKEIKEKYQNLRTLRDRYSGLVELFRIDWEKEKRFAGLIETFKTLLDAIKNGYDEKLAADGQVDFDLIIEKADEVLRKVDPGNRYVMVDEFQDTNALQWSIVRRIAQKSNLFVVGDEKQSIYSFQGGEIEVFKNALEERFKGRVVPMNVNYRSDKAVLSFVNELFFHIFSPPKNMPLRTDFYAEHQALDAHSEEQGSVILLLTKKPEKEDEISAAEKEAETIARFIVEIRDGKHHRHIKKLMDARKPAIAVLYDARGKMPELKKALDRYGVACKVSAGENFWQKPEIRDIYFVLHALQILSQKSNFDDFDRYVFAGALKSDIVHQDDAKLYEAIEKEDYEAIGRWNETMPLSLHERIRRLFIDSGAYLAYAVRGEGFEQAAANIESLIHEAVLFESEYGYDLRRFVEMMRENIFFSDVEKEEAFFRAEGLESVELCSIHSTKGLAYPMVILADTAKRLTRQTDTEGIKQNRFKDAEGREHTLMGFKLGDYSPLPYRLLSHIDRLKHIEEKKRLLYVALTRAEHDLVISGIEPFEKDSYAEMLAQALRVESFADMPETLELPECRVNVWWDDAFEKPKEKPITRTFECVEPLKALPFEEKEYTTPSKSDETYDSKQALIGTIVHRIIDLYHETLHETQIGKVLDEYAIDDPGTIEKIEMHIEAFKHSPIYTTICGAKEKFFEFPIETETVRGSIDLLYCDEKKKEWVVVDFKTGRVRDHSAQLEKYVQVLQEKGFQSVRSEIVYI